MSLRVIPDIGPGIILAQHLDRWGEPHCFGLPMSDLTSHMIVTGTTGSGKSTLLRSLAMQVYKQGGTVIVLDPHDDLILEPKEGLLAAMAQDPDPLSRAGVLLVDFAGAHPPCLNLLQSAPRRERAVMVERIMRCIEAVEDANWGGAVRMREILEHGLHIVLHYYREEASMFHLEAFLSEPLLRYDILNQLQHDPAVWESRRFWDRLHRLIREDPRQTDEEMMQYPLRRIGRFLTKPLLRHTLALPALDPEHMLNLEALMNSANPSLILVPLSAARLGADTKRILGTLLLQLISDTFRARAEQPRADRRPVLVLLDEFADLAAHEHMGLLVKNLLAQDRKYGAAVVLGTQSLAQLPHEVRLEVRNNTNNKVILRAANEADAQAAIADMASDQLQPIDVLTLERYSGYARVLVLGHPCPPATIRAWRPWRPHVPPQALWVPKMPEMLSHPQLARLRRLRDLAPLTPREAEQKEVQEHVKELFGELTTLSEEEFAAVVEGQVKFFQYEWQRLLATPQAELPYDRPEQLRILSKDRYGLSWWLYEAQYRRLRQKIAGEVETLAKAKAQAGDGARKADEENPTLTTPVDNTAGEPATTGQQPEGQPASQETQKGGAPDLPLPGDTRDSKQANPLPNRYLLTGEFE